MFYRLNRTSAPKIQSRLVGDLEEISLIVAKYSSDSSCIMHPKQKYSKDWFQGNPIYVLKVHKNVNDNVVAQYSFKDSYEKKLIFLVKKM